MDLLAAHELFTTVEDRPPAFITVRLADGSELTIEAWPAVMTAAVSLTGWLEDANDLADLWAAVGHFNGCVAAGVFGEQDWLAEAGRVLTALMAWGEEQERRGCSTS